ncbi:HNH endonuclease [Peribacillus sp. B-H-3]|uniref:HNH endonuclease n=1 Tax=Peribacillus sp. B-H-3 TaxID=3400420 RepID=UPI003B02B833
MNVWLKPARLEFDVAEAFKELGSIDWGTRNNIQKGDIVYIYMSAPVSKIIFKAQCTEEDISKDKIPDHSKFYRIPIADSVIAHKDPKKIIRLKPVLNLTSLKEELTYERLKEEGMASTLVRDTRRLDNKPGLLEYIRKVEEGFKVRVLKKSISKLYSKTEVNRLIKARVGQGYFKRMLLKKSSECCLCGLRIKELLVASHIKPWRACNNEERLNSNNGLLLCTGHDALFDKGFISFDTNGGLLLSQKLTSNDLHLLHVDPLKKIFINKEQQNFMEFHRLNKFIK